MFKITFTEGAKKTSWKEFKAQFMNVDPLQEMTEKERELFLAEKWQELTGKNLKIDDKKGEGE